jgi:putative PEP-CTERM system TPR-repeat lipoprotein
MHRLLTSLISSIFALAVAFAGPAASQAPVNSYYEDAQRYHAEGDRSAALIQLKNALLENNQDVPSLLLMGDIYLEMGEAPAAEVAYGDALLLGADPGYTTPKIAEAYLIQRKYRKILDELNPDRLSGTFRAELLGYQAFAHLGVKEPRAAQETLGQAMSIDPQARVPDIARVSILLGAGKAGEALVKSEMLVDRYPYDARSWAAHGDVLYAMGREEQALMAYSNAVKHNPHLNSARLARAALLANSDQFEAASADIDFLRKHYPQEPRAAYFKAELLEASGQSAQALELYQQVAELISLAKSEDLDDDLQLTVMSATAHAKTGGLVQARQYLVAFQKNNMNNSTTGKMLAELLLDEGNGNGALEVLEPLLDRVPDDLELLRLKALALSSLGRYKQAIAVWRTLAESDDGNTEAAAQIAVNQIRGGYIDAGIAGLEQILEDNDILVRERAILANAYLESGNFVGAASLGEQLVKLAPDNPEFGNLLGRSYMYLGKLEQAHQILFKAVAAHPDFFPVQISLAEVETARGNIDDARVLLHLMSEKYPDNPAVLLQQARVARLSGDLKQARKSAENALVAETESIETTKFLIRVLLELGEEFEAEQLARDTAARNRQSAEAQFILGQVLMALGKPTEARSGLILASRRALPDHALLYRIAREQIALGALTDAGNSLLQAIGARPDILAYREANILVELQLQKYEQALELTSGLIEDFPGSAAPHTLRAAAYSGLGKVREAEAEFAKAQLLDPNNSSILIGRYGALLALGDTARAEAALTDWLEKSPGDLLASYAYAEMLINSQRWPQAKVVLAGLLERQPDNPLFLNNMAYVLQEMGEPEAVEIARRAYALAPHNPYVNDTLGWTLVRNGRAEEGLAYLREAVARQADTPVIRYHLAVALNELGRPSEAAKELSLILSQPEPFKEREHALELLAAIQ